MIFFGKLFPFFTEETCTISLGLLLNDIVRRTFKFVRTRNFTVHLSWSCYIVLLGKLFVFLAQVNSTVSQSLRF